MRIHIGKNGTAIGPFTREEFLAKLADGSIGMNDLAWTDGQGDWVRVSQFLIQQGLPPPVPVVVAPTPASGQGRVSENAELLRLADTRLAGNWWPTFGTLFLANLIGSMVANIPFIGFIAQLLVAPVLELGALGYVMNRARVGAPEPEVGAIFTPFKNYGRALGIVYWQVLWYVIWGLPALLVLVPCVLMVSGAAGESMRGNPLAVGFLLVVGLAVVVGLSVLALRYALCSIHALDEPALPVADCLDESVRLMRGNKLRFWLLGLRAMLAPMLALLGCGLATMLMVAAVVGPRSSGRAAGGLLVLATGLLAMIPLVYWLARCALRYRVAMVIFKDELVHLDRTVRRPS